MCRQPPSDNRRSSHSALDVPEEQDDRESATMALPPSTTLLDRRRPVPYGATQDHSLTTHWHSRNDAYAKYVSIPDNYSSSTSPSAGHDKKHQDVDAIDWTSLLVIYALTVVAEAARGLLLPSTWPYFASLGGSKAQLGVLVGSYSLGRMLSVVPLGHLSDSLSSASVLVLASYIQAFGHLVYAVAPNVPSLYMARIIVGFGSATTSVARAHITKAIPSEHRTHHLAYLSGLQFVGFAVLPAFGGVFSLFPTFLPLPFVNLNGFTYPAWVLVVANCTCALLVRSYYKDPPPSPVPSPVSPSSPSSSISSSPSSSQDTMPSHIAPSSPSPFISPDYFALIISLIINLVFRGVLAELETVSIPFMIEQYHVSYTTASVWMTLIGIVGVGTYFSFKPIARAFSDRALVAVGMAFIALGCLPLSISTLVARMDAVVYITFLAFTWSVAYPIGQTAILALFSKVLGGCSVGSFMGIFSASGALSPLILPIIATNLWDSFGRESVFRFITFLVAGAAVLFAYSRHRLISPGLPC